MSLDVYITTPNTERSVVPARIFIRENGSTREITREEWDAKYPGTDPCVVSEHDEGDARELFSLNITHNLGKMAREAGIYDHLWRPDEIGITKAAQLIEPLSTGLQRLHADPAGFAKYNPANGWGDYEGLCAFVGAYLSACIWHKDGDIRVSR
jgi:hypothetical protein